MLLHQKAGVPLKAIHTGGDEVPVGAWQKSPICQTLVTENPAVEGDEIGLTNYFLKNHTSQRSNTLYPIPYLSHLFFGYLKVWDFYE